VIHPLVINVPGEFSCLARLLIGESIPSLEGSIPSRATGERKNRGLSHKFPSVTNVLVFLSFTGAS
jgi:hypothetical protein